MSHQRKIRWGRLGAQLSLGFAASLVALSAGCWGQDDDTLRFADSACAACLDVHCAQEIEACFGEPGCAAFLNCLDECPESMAGLPLLSCEQGCPRPDGSVAAQLLDDYLGCRDVGMGKLECGECTGGFTACEECAYSVCTAEDDACYGVTACASYMYCLVECDEQTPPPNNVLCADRCGAGQPDWVIAAARASDVCNLAACAEECLVEPTPCLVCFLRECEDEYSACLLDPGCDRLFRCQGDCVYAEDQVACMQACEAGATPEALALDQVMSTCMHSQCPCN